MPIKDRTTEPMVTELKYCDLKIASMFRFVDDKPGTIRFRTDNGYATIIGSMVGSAGYHHRDFDGGHMEDQVLLLTAVEIHGKWTTK